MKEVNEMGKVDPYLHAVLLLHGLGKEITEDAIVAVIKAAGGEVDEARASTVAEAVKNVNIEEAIEKAAAMPVAAAPAPAQAGGEAKEEKKEEEKEEKKEEEAAAGLASLFG